MRQREVDGMEGVRRDTEAVRELERFDASAAIGPERYLVSLCHFVTGGSASSPR